MKIISTILIILNFLFVQGQIEFRGILKSYEDTLELPFAIICIDTFDIYKGFSVHQPIDRTNTNEKGIFFITTKLTGKMSLHVIYVNYVGFTIKNIEVEKNKKVIDLGIIYLPYRGQWFEGYKPPEGATKKEARKSRKEWRRNGGLYPNWAGFSSDFFEPYKGMETIYLEYPLNGTKKEFKIKEESLIIDYKEFIKK